VCKKKSWGKFANILVASRLWGSEKSTKDVQREEIWRLAFHPLVRGGKASGVPEPLITCKRPYYKKNMEMKKKKQGKLGRAKKKTGK